MVLVLLAVGPACAEETAPAAGSIERTVQSGPRDAGAPDATRDGGRRNADPGPSAVSDQAFGFDEFATQEPPAAPAAGQDADDGGAEPDCPADAPACVPWSCRFEQRGGDDGCSCGCGALDPECHAGEGCAEPGCRAPGCITCRRADGAPMSCMP